MSIYSNCQVCGNTTRHSKTDCLDALKRKAARVDELEAGLAGAQAENRELLARLELVYTGSAGTEESMTV